MDWIGQKYTYKDFKSSRTVYNLQVKLPSKPPREKVLNFDLPKKDQKFSAIVKDVEDTLKRLDWMGADDYERFVHREWDRRINGVWFFNNGYLEYVTGLHYFYCCFWKIPVVDEKTGSKRLGLPSWVDSDRDHFYFWNQCVIDPLSFGMFEITNRRDGKSYRGLSTNYELISRTPESLSGMQSKTGNDGKSLFNRLVKSWQKLPEFFKPIDEGESHPKSSLRFYEPGKRDTKSQKKRYKEVLRSEITYGSAKDEEYDGEGISFYFADEIGKTAPKEANVHRRHYIVKETMVDGSRITGKYLGTTTVEEITREGLLGCKQLWEESDIMKRNELGQTASGLYRYFKPAYYGYRGEFGDQKFIDEYGYSNWKPAMEYLEKRRKNKKGEALAGEKRKYPFTEYECFIHDNQGSPFDLNRIYAQMDHNSSLDQSFVTRGNFIWIEKDVKATFVHDDNGKWRVVWLPDGEKIKANQFIMQGSRRTPANTLMLCSGTDPIEHGQLSGTKGSQGSSHVRYKYDPIDPDNSKFFAAHYLSRPPLPETFFEDMIIQAFYYGCEMLVESNKIGLINYFKSRGYEGYLMKRPEPTQTPWSRKHQKEYGIPMTGADAREALIQALVTETYTNIGYLEEEERWARMYLNDTLLELTEFDVKDWTPYDSCVSMGLALLAERKYILSRKSGPGEAEFLPMYKNVGTKSYRVR